MNKTLKDFSTKPIGVLGSGYFGTAIANILAQKTIVLLHIHNPESFKIKKISRISAEQILNKNIHPTTSLRQIANTCNVIFVIVPSDFFELCIKSISPFLTKNHILIHGTKGLHINPINSTTLSKNNILTMSKIILKETSCTKVGCISGPNLAKELAEGQPAGTVLASEIYEVLEIGKSSLQTPFFKVNTSTDLLGTELCGVFKNAIAIAIGFASGLNLGCNTKGLLISKGLNEILKIGTTIGATTESFIGLAGIGDIVATSMSNSSRNHSLGYKLATGQSLNSIIKEKSQTIEGINTVKILYLLAKNHNIHTTIITTLYKLLYDNMKIEDVMKSFLQ